MNLIGTFTGTFESTWSMHVPDLDYQDYLHDHPDFDATDEDQMQEAWDYFKGLGCYDEPDGSFDRDITMIGLEAQ